MQVHYSKQMLADAVRTVVLVLVSRLLWFCLDRGRGEWVPKV